MYNTARTDSIMDTDRTWGEAADMPAAPAVVMLPKLK
jgi:hypothetical protein